MEWPADPREGRIRVRVTSSCGLTCTSSPGAISCQSSSSRGSLAMTTLPVVARWADSMRVPSSLRWASGLAGWSRVSRWSSWVPG